MAKPGVPLDRGEPDSKQPPSLLLSVPLSLSSLAFPARGEGGPSHMALECRPEAAGRETPGLSRESVLAAYPEKDKLSPMFTSPRRHPARVQYVTYEEIAPFFCNECTKQPCIYFTRSLQKKNPLR